MLQKIDAPEPFPARRFVDDEWIDVLQHHESFAYVRERVNEIGIFQTPEGWFRQKSARREYARARLGESD